MNNFATGSIYKFAFITQHIPHYRAVVLGELAKSKHIGFVFCSDKVNYDIPDIESWIMPTTVKWQHHPCYKIKGHFMWQSGLVRVALSRDFDGLIFTGDPYWPATWIAAFLARLTGKRVLFWTIGWMGLESGFKSFIRRLFMSIPNDLMLYGHYARGRAIGLGFDPNRLHVIYNSLDYSSQRVARQLVSNEMINKERLRLFGDADAIVFVCISRLSRARRLDLVIDAMVGLKIFDKPVHLLLVGDGNECNNLKTLAKKNCVSVFFYGACYDQSKLALLTMLAIATVAPGMVGLTAMQSLAFGIPVITHSTRSLQAPESESIEDGVTGYLFNLEEADGLSKAMQRAVADCRPRKDIAEECIANIESRWNAENQVRLILRAINGEISETTDSNFLLAVEQQGIEDSKLRK